MWHSVCLVSRPSSIARRGVKDMNVQLLGSLAYLVALVLVDWFLLFGPPAMGIEGAGYGASLAQWVGAATVCWLLARKQVRAAAAAAAAARLAGLQIFAGLLA